MAYGEIEPQQAGDKPTMSIVRQFFKEAKDIRSIQKVSLKLWLIHISDFSSAYGRRLEETFLQTKLAKRSINIYEWTSKYHAVDTEYTAWINLLKHIIRADNYHLSTHLGK